MVEFLEFNSIDIVATRVVSKITEDDWENIRQVVSEKIMLYGRVNWYYEMHDFKGWDWEAFFSDVTFSLKNADHFKRIAFVGNNFIENIMAKVSSFFTSAEVRYYDLKDRSAAIDWIKYGINHKTE